MSCDGDVSIYLQVCSHECSINPELSTALDLVVNHSIAVYCDSSIGLNFSPINKSAIGTSLSSSIYSLACDVSVQANGSVGVKLLTNNHIVVQVDAASRLDRTHNIKGAIEGDLMFTLDALGALVGWLAVVARHVEVCCSVLKCSCKRGCCCCLSINECLVSFESL